MKLIAKLVAGAPMLAFGLLASAALARPGCVFQDAFLFTDPTYNGYLIGTIPAPAPVELVRMGKNWSIISYDGETGYVATRHLVPNSGARADPPPGIWRQRLTLRREIDPLFYWPDGGRFGLRGRAFGGQFAGDGYFSGFRRSPWTDRTNWRRVSYLGPDSPKWAACGLAVDHNRRAGGRRSR